MYNWGILLHKSKTTYSINMKLRRVKFTLKYKNGTTGDLQLFHLWILSDVQRYLKLYKYSFVTNLSYHMRSILN